MPFLEAWATERSAPPFCAVLGEYGIGKTTTLKVLTRQLLQRRRQGEDVPLPTFIDLRFYSETVRRGEVPTLDRLLAEILARAWIVSDRPPITPQDIQRMVREQGALLIFDGLDEKLVHLDEPQAQEFIRQLWSALPPHRLRSPRPGDPSGAAAVEPAAGARAAAPSPGRLLFSCRAHYFKTIRDQNAAFTGQDRDSVQAGDYRACVLLPFNEQQILPACRARVLRLGG